MSSALTDFQAELEFLRRALDVSLRSTVSHYNEHSRVHAGTPLSQYKRMASVFVEETERLASAAREVFDHIDRATR